MHRKQWPRQQLVSEPGLLHMDIFSSVFLPFSATSRPAAARASFAPPEAGRRGRVGRGPVGGGRGVHGRKVLTARCSQRIFDKQARVWHQLRQRILCLY